MGTYVDKSTMVVVVGSCDKYEACWQPMIHGIKKYWADRLWNIIFITNEVDIAGYRTISVGKDSRWGYSVITALKEIKDPYILWLMDDFWITGPVDTQIIKRYLRILHDNKLHHIRLLPPADDTGKVVPERECKYASLYHINLWHFYDDAEFKVSASLGIWEKEVLLSYLREDMTPWQFEKESIEKSKAYPNKYLCNINPRVFPTGWYCNPYPNGKCSFMSRGKWDKAAYEYAHYEGLNIDFSKHPDGTKNEAYNI